MKKLFLLDAYALIYRAYYAFIKSPRINSRGLNTSAIYGFINTLEDVLRREQPTHIGVAFDPAGPTFRHEAFEQYKAQRESTPEDIRRAVPCIKQVIEAYNIPVLEVAGFEADDVIGTLAKQAEQHNFETFMLTPDKDYGQLVSEHIFMYRPRHSGGFEMLGAEGVKAKYSLADVSQVIDLLGLMGDKSDNIPGCPGVGEKTAVKLLQEFGSIDKLLANTARIKGALREKIEENSEQILFSRFLATIRTDVPIVLDEAQLERKAPNEEQLSALFNELEFRALKEKILGSRSPNSRAGLVEAGFEKKAVPAKKPQQPDLFSGQMSLFDEGFDNSTSSLQHFAQPTETLAGADLQSTPDTHRLQTDVSDEIAGHIDSYRYRDDGFMTIHSNPHTYSLIDTEEKLSNLITNLSKQESFCFDTETTGVDTFTAELVGLSFCWQASEACYLPVPANRAEAQALLDRFKPIFANEQIEKIGQNIKFDMLMLAHYGVKLQGKLFDTMIAHYLLQPELRHGMDYLAEIYLRYRTIHYDELFTRHTAPDAVSPKKQEIAGHTSTTLSNQARNDAKNKDIRTVDLELLKDYAAEDADITFRLKELLEKEITANRLEPLFYDIEMPLVRVLVAMEQTGVRIDSTALSQSSEILTEEMRQVEAEIHRLAGANFNISSARQVGEVLFEQLKIVDKPKKTKTGQYSTSEDILESLKTKHPIVGKILDYRGLKKLLSTYIDALPLLVNKQTGKIHTSYNQTVVATGRLSSSSPNLQNIPVRDEQGKEIRKAFIPDERCVFLSADYSQIELRIMAHLSGDPNMTEAFLSGNDIHTATAAKIYNLPIEEVTSGMRRKAKTANFGIIYGISVFGLADRLGIARAEAKELIDGYFATYPQVKAYMEQSIATAREQGYVETLLHRKRFLPDIRSGNSVVRGYAERNAINAPIQGTAADIIKIAMVRIFECFEREGVQAKMTMQVHDELNFSVPVAELEQVKQIVISEMENAFTLRVPLIADCGTGTNWLEAH